MPLARALLLVAVTLLTHVVSAPAQVDPDVEAAGRVVLEQLDAFRRDDFDRAFGLASSQIRQLFDRLRFEAMVRNGYPEIARSVSALVAGGERRDGDLVYLLVRVRGANGQRVEAVYEMVLENGAWRINGVATRPDVSETT
jgi:Domain of unknown function (DUF4864)